MYDEWLEHGRGEKKYDEARIRAQFPPEKFQEFKDKLPTKVSSYEEFLALAKRHFETMAEKRPEIEAEMRRACPPELFRYFNETKARSARFWADKLCKTTPLLIMQGSDDQNCALLETGVWCKSTAFRHSLRA